MRPDQAKPKYCRRRNEKQRHGLVLSLEKFDLAKGSGNKPAPFSSLKGAFRLHPPAKDGNQCSTNLHQADCFFLTVARSLSLACISGLWQMNQTMPQLCQI
jgi:hypothetical protein